MENTTAPAVRIHRSRTNRMLGGVCGGLAESFGVDVNLIRIALVVLTILGVGAGVVLYLVMWALAPEEDATPAAPTSTPAGPFAA
jgi:phage shock protein C